MLYIGISGVLLSSPESLANSASSVAQLFIHSRYLSIAFVSTSQDRFNAERVHYYVFRGVFLLESSSHIG